MRLPLAFETRNSPSISNPEATSPWNSLNPAAFSNHIHITIGILVATLVWPGTPHLLFQKGNRQRDAAPNAAVGFAIAVQPPHPDRIFPAGFFDRRDAAPDSHFYAQQRFVTHIDDRAIKAVGQLYQELGIEGRVLDLMSSWISHFVEPPEELVVLGMNQAELSGNQAAASAVLQDLNDNPELPFADEEFDHVVCCVSVDYLTKPFEVFAQVARVLKPGGLFVTTFSNRCFPTKAIAGWLATNDDQHMEIVSRYFAETAGFDPPTAQARLPPGGGDPLYAVFSSSAKN